MRKGLLVVFAVCSAISSLSSQTLEDAKELLYTSKYSKALPIFSKLAEQGNLEAYYYIGTIYEKSTPDIYGVYLKDSRLAIESYKIGAELGDIGCLFALGIKYKAGDGVIQSYHEAIKYLLQASLNNHRNAYIVLANCYYEILDNANARIWYEKAALSGDTIAQVMMTYFCRLEGRSDEMYYWALLANIDLKMWKEYYPDTFTDDYEFVSMIIEKFEKENVLDKVEEIKKKAIDFKPEE